MLYGRREGQADFDFYPYNPSAAAGWGFCILFSSLTFVHFAYIILYRTWYFIPFFLGCAAEAGGYYSRAWAHNNRRLGDPYLLQLFLIIGATPLLSASIYMALSRIIRSLDAVEYARFTVKWISRLYILIDIACLVLQVMGTVMEAYGDAATKKNSVHYIAGGLIFQLVAFGVFALLAVRVHAKLTKQPSVISGHRETRWQRYFWILYVSSVLILIRNLVRVCEFLQGSEGVIQQHEAFLYALDAVPMSLMVLAFTAVYPGKLAKTANEVRKMRSTGIATPLTTAKGYAAI